MMVIPVIMVLERAVRDAGIPIAGISVGDPNNRATWSATYINGVTDQQKAQVVQILATIDPQDATIVSNIKTDLAQAVGVDVLTAIAQALWEAIPTPALTLPQMRQRAIALYKAKL